jgi:hypothetical protein
VQNTRLVVMQKPCQYFLHIMTGNIWKCGFGHFFHLEKYVKPPVCGLPKADELRAKLINGESAEVREQLAILLTWLCGSMNG